MPEKFKDIVAIIPARYGSTRLPGKPLIDFHGKPMIQWVNEAATQIFDRVAVATDDERILAAVEAIGGTGIRTRDDHMNGSSRVAEAFDKTGWQASYVVNIQGDEPMITTNALREFGDALCAGDSDIGTQISRVRDEAELYGESEVFVVANNRQQALYFSRSIIPFYRDIPKDQWLEHGKFMKHLGLYAFKPSVLAAVVNLSPSPLEQAESLEQNRWLENGYSIQLVETNEICHPVDTPRDVEYVRELMAKQMAK